MEFRDALKLFRSELGITQLELATALHINSVTVRRWEAGQNTPNRSTVAMLVDYAKKSGAPPVCISRLCGSTVGAAKDRLEKKNGSLYSIEHSSLENLVADASFPIYVCDLETDEILYLNDKAQKMIGDGFRAPAGRKCYECIMHRDTPCEFCRKNELREDRFIGHDAYRPFDGAAYRCKGRIMRWNGHKAQVRCVSSIGQTLSISVQRERENSYLHLLRMRKELASDCVAMAHYNLTQNKVSDIQSENEALLRAMMSGTADKVLHAISSYTYDEEEQKEFSIVCDRRAMIELFYSGKTHISFRHHLKGDKRYYETTFDLLQNPSTYDIEAISILRNITDGALIEEVAAALLGLDYETIVLIDAETGDAHPLFWGHIEGVIDEQKQQGDPVAGVREYLKKHCVDDDAERVIRETSLAHVIEQLKTRHSYSVSYTLNQDGRIIHKRTFFSYLDRTHTSILCAMQDITETFKNEALDRDRVMATLEIIQEISHADVGRYDLRTRSLLGSSKLMNALGYGEIIEDIPEAFIRNGTVSAESEEEFREFFRNIHDRHPVDAAVWLAVGGGSFHCFKLKAKLLPDETGELNQAIIVYQDIEEQREQATIYRKWTQALKNRDPEAFMLFCCNLSRGVSFDKVQGRLMKTALNSSLATFNERTMDYAGRYVHPDDRLSYTKLLNLESLIGAYRHGTNTLATNYREIGIDTEPRWIHLSVEMTQYPDSDDIEAFLFYEKV